MNYQELADIILEKVGGKSNVTSLTHCATRLRFVLKDDSLADDETIKATKGVVGLAKSGGQYQIVIGSDVQSVYRPLTELLDLDESGQQLEETDKAEGLGQKILATISGIFTPILPIITAAGMIKAVLSLLVVFKVVTATDTNYQILNFIGDAGFYFLPIFLGGTAARQFKSNQYLGMLIGAILLHPTFTTLVTSLKESGDSLALFGLPISLVSYSSTVIPVILSVWFMAYVERFADKISPKAVKFFLVPMITTLVTAVIALVVIGPLGSILGDWLAAFFTWLENFGPWVVPTLVGVFSPFLVMTGTHYGLVSLGINNRMTIGYDTIAQPGMLPSNVAQGGAALAIAIKTKDADKKALASSAGITAIFGITEPALYGVTLQNRAALIGSMVAGGIGGFFLGIMGARNFSGGSPGLLTVAAYIGDNTLYYFYVALAGIALSVLIAFVVTFILYKED
ncbi:PTS transporter subunit EIIC [Streptococcus loxodontisalivarius]|uniref:PTS system beta-glucosides-specific IIC component n=1 Tax=Streptococcus loxodontisalivarius TaxID=1349415 RepID=A0ABS2PPG0_9STRE|nr:PTS transporter subunit EIIC [Streptococcus loxodontisalivarius]MBM7641922.1 PTS system beta-glucosides-specific IIC component [Streptococcus loxodontisalivarius]